MGNGKGLFYEKSIQGQRAAALDLDYRFSPGEGVRLTAQAAFFENLPPIVHYGYGGSKRPPYGCGGGFTGQGNICRKL